jgi:hypothetical protein
MIRREVCLSGEDLGLASELKDRAASNLVRPSGHRGYTPRSAGSVNSSAVCFWADLGLVAKASAGGLG